MNLKQIEELIEKAKAATPGPWQERIWHGSLECASGLKTICFMAHGPIHERQKIEQYEDCVSKTVKDSEFIAAANPQVVLDLCERVIRLSEALELVNDYPCRYCSLPDSIRESLDRFGVNYETTHR